MIRFILSSAFLLILHIGYAQFPALNMSQLGLWTVDSLPVHSGIKFNDVWGYADCSGREYAILGSAGRIHFIDVTTPNQAYEIASFPGTTNSVWRDFKTYRDRAYACADQGQDGLMVFDMSRLPDTVILSYQSNADFNRSHNLWIDTLQGRLYMAGTNTQSNGVIIYDLTQNPDQPELIASIPLPGGYIHDIHVVDNIAYCSHGGNGLWVYDITDPLNLITLGNMTDYPERGYNHSSWINEDGSYLIMADETHGTSLKVVDVRDFEDIAVTSLFKSALLQPEFTGSIVHNPFIRDQYVVLAYYHDGIQIYDMSDPANVTRVAYYDTYPTNINYNGFKGAWGAYPYLPSGNILGSDISNGLFILRADSLSFSDGPRHRFPNADIITQNPAICTGSNAILEAAAGAEAYTWLRNGELIHQEGLSINIDTGGYYQVQTANGHCISVSDSLWVAESAPPTLVTDLETNTLCAGDSSLFYITTNADAAFLFRADGFRTPLNLNYAITEAGTYGLELLNDNCTFILDSIFSVTILQPRIPSISQSGNTLQCNNAAEFLQLQWYRNGQPIPGANTATFAFSESGIYTLETTDTNGCNASSTPISVIVSSTANPSAEQYTIFPNPVKSGASIRLPANGPMGQQFVLTDLNGRVLEQLAIQTTTLTLANHPAGVYRYLITHNDNVIHFGKIVITP
jgi:choice-of-anchor B domain-containing protein